jgi:hypothetical protein
MDSRTKGVFVSPSDRSLARQPSAAYAFLMTRSASILLLILLGPTVGRAAESSAKVVGISDGELWRRCRESSAGG